MKKAVQIVDDPEHIKLLANSIHEEILQLLREQPMTETQLSKELGMTRSAIGYHLKLLIRANLIYVIKKEVEQHGITQKFYSPIAKFILANYDRVSNDARRYFIQMQIEFLRGVFAALKLHNSYYDISPKTLEKLAESMLKQLMNACINYMDEIVVENSVNLNIKIYAKALSLIMKQDEWHNLFK